MSEEQNISIIKRTVDLINQRKLSQLVELTHPNFKRHDLAGALPEVTGTQGTVNLMQMVIQAIPDMRYEIKQIIAKNDRVVVQARGEGTHRGEFLGVAGTGKQIEWNAINIYRFEDGKVIETWQLLDVWGLMRQMRQVS
ncbi:ester cyclase [Candidatus Bathyarchaeota archaeon]|nr:ester cyclase [Candidatus Bathyarchaeota archaeon]